MKVRHGIFIALLATVLTFCFSFNVIAMTTGFEVKSEKIVENDNINFKAENEEYHFHSIKCFDISDMGLIAIGISEGNKHHINIYDNNCAFKYGYSFECYGNFGIEFDNDNIIIYTVRSNTAYLIDKKGNCLEQCDILNNSENNSYWNNVVFAKLKESDGNKYYLTKSQSVLGLFSPSYSQLIKKDSNYKETILLDVSKENDIYIVVLGISFTLVIGISVIAAINFYRKKANKLQL